MTAAPLYWQERHQPADPDFRERQRVQEAMAAVIRSSEQGGWVWV